MAMQYTSVATAHKPWTVYTASSKGGIPHVRGGPCMYTRGQCLRLDNLGCL